MPSWLHVSTFLLCTLAGAAWGLSTGVFLTLMILKTPLPIWFSLGLAKAATLSALAGFALFLISTVTWLLAK